MLANLKAAWTTEPVRLTALLVAAVVFAAAQLDIVLDPLDVGEAIAVLLPILLGGELARAKVSPAHGPIGPDSDRLLPDDAV